MIPGGLDLLNSCIQDSRKKSPIRLTPAEWLERIPCKVFNPDRNKSYLIISVSKEGLWFHDTITLYDEDAYFGDGSYEVDCPSIMTYENMPVNLEFGDEPTEKQIKWLEEHDLMTESMTKQEAWVIINYAVKKAQRENERRRQENFERHIGSRLDRMLDADDIIGQCGGCIDDEVDWTY